MKSTVSEPREQTEIKGNQGNGRFDFNRMPNISPAMRTTPGGFRYFFSTITACFHNASSPWGIIARNGQKSKGEFACLI